MLINLPKEDEIRATQFASEIADYEAEHAKLFLSQDFDLAAALSWIREHIFVCSRHSYLQGARSQNMQDEKQNPEEILNKKSTYDLSRGFGKIEKD